MKILLECAAALALFAITLSPLLLAWTRRASGRRAKRAIAANLAAFAAFCLLATLLPVGGIAFAAEEGQAAASSNGLGLLAMALATGMSSLGAGIATAAAASSAIGAISENPENFSKALIFVALAEGVAVYGLLISVLIMNQL